ncbi:MotA/TolQ/ExbB proton channel family protein [Clostridium sp. SYSU_GA19001]|uniref:motility protein A n=1 Tax=Clostridium caldaquaticum TaxID=2940653 RepID=UPI002076D603|nr:MotA/TolQ/ExbB proton channel family protein [Clostridium caldaquaticum]MCM8710691.1 MotA/TolQ/ExbB proton channel family protein [Clostridium caldaquaticum]
MDKMSFLGLVLAVGFILYGILSSGSIFTFIDLPSVYITIGGTFGALLLSTKGKNAKTLFKLFSLVFKENKSNDEEIINNLVEWSMKARKEGLLSLEDTIETISDSFIKKGMMMIVDGAEPDTIKNVLGLKIRGIIERHKSNRGMFDTGAALGPAFGMIGTLIGLVNMLKTLSDPSTIGPQMSVALITTFYGSLLANVVFMPMSKKLKAKTEEEVYQKEMIIEGLLSIQAGENPNTLREKMLSFLDDKTAKKMELMNSKEGEK